MTDPTRQQRILIVDDEEKNFRLISAILKTHD